jgi:Integrase core domain
MSWVSCCRDSPWENGYIESFNARVRDELLDGEIFYSLKEAQNVIESWRRRYNPASQHPSVYVIGREEVLLIGGMWSREVVGALPGVFTDPGSSAAPTSIDQRRERSSRDRIETSAHRPTLSPRSGNS